MKTRTKIALALAAIAVSYPVLAYLSGRIIDAHLQENEKKFLQEAPYFTLIGREYQRGLFESTWVATYGLDRKYLDTFLGGFFKQTKSAPAFTVRSHIHHGPFPRHSGVALAVIDTQWQMPEELQKTLVGLKREEPIFRAHSRMSLFGRTASEVSGPAFQYRNARGETVFSWQGLTGRIAVGGSDAYEGELSSGGLVFNDPRAPGEIRDLRITFDTQSTSEGLEVGKVGFAIGGIELPMPAHGPVFSLRDVAMDIVSTLRGKLYQSDARLKAGGGHVGGTVVTDLLYDFSFKHIHAPSLAALSKALQGFDGKFPEPLRTHGHQILLNNPMVEVRHIGFSTPEGALKLSGNMLIKGLRQQDLEGAQATKQIFDHCVARLDFAVDEALATRLEDTGAGRTAAFLKTMGVLKRENNKLIANIRMGNGGISINGKPFGRGGTVPAVRRPTS